MLKAFASGKGTGKHGLLIDRAVEVEYTCEECKQKFDPKEARWIGIKCLCPVCHPEPTSQDE